PQEVVRQLPTERPQRIRQRHSPSLSAWRRRKKGPPTGGPWIPPIRHGPGLYGLDRAGQPLPLQRPARRLALRANAVHLQAVPYRPEPLLPGQLLLQTHELRRVDLLHAPALRADQVLANQRLP